MFYITFLEATLTVSPKRQYLGILEPTTPAVVAPLWIPILIFSLRLGSWGIISPGVRNIS